MYVFTWYLHKSDTRSLNSGLLLKGNTEHLYGAITGGKDRYCKYRKRKTDLYSYRTVNDIYHLNTLFQLTS